MSFLGVWEHPTMPLVHQLSVVNPRPLPVDPSQSDELTESLSALGARVIRFPCLQFEPVDGPQIKEALANLAQYQWLIVTSSNGVDFFMRAAHRYSISLADFSHLRIAAIGEGTAGHLQTHGLVASLIPENYVAESLLRELLAHSQPQQRFLLPRAAQAREILIEGLRVQGRVVDDLAVYRATKISPSQQLTQQAKSADWAFITSAAIARSYTENTDGPSSQKMMSIGPITTAELRRLGWQNVWQPNISRIESMISTWSALCDSQLTQSS